MELLDLWYSSVTRSVFGMITMTPDDIYNTLVAEHQDNAFMQEDDLTEQHRTELLNEFGVHPFTTLLLEYGKQKVYSEKDFIDDTIDGMKYAIEQNRPIDWVQEIQLLANKNLT